MEKSGDQRSIQEQEASGLFTLAFLSLLVGGLTGLVGALFKTTLAYMDRLRNAYILVERQDSHVGFVFFIFFCALAVFISILLVQRFSIFAQGSGIPHVEAVLEERAEMPSLALLPVKFIVGALAIGAGLMLGVELDRPCGVLLSRAAQAGLLISVTADSVIRLVPPLILSAGEADEIVARLAPLVRAFLAEPAA